ncbi:MAG: hypothetical protein RI567_00050 [Marinobacter sp.]|nr:hypothetical protein [Marinobacter sp.]
MTKRILRTLAPTIKRLVPSKRLVVTSDLEEFGYLRTLSYGDVLRISFSAWRVMLSPNSRHHSVPYSRYFFNTEYVNVPSPPVLLSEVEVSGERFDATETLSLQLYRAEFWRSYLGLVGHLNTLNNALRLGQTWRDYYHLLPEDAVPCRFERIGLDIKSNILTVILLQRHARPTRDSVQASLDTYSRLHECEILDGEMDQRWTSLNQTVYEMVARDKILDEQAEAKMRAIVNGQSNIF